jgi:hypothetical protein
MAVDGYTMANSYWKGELRLLSVALVVVTILILRLPLVIRYRLWQRKNAVS